MKIGVISFNIHSVWSNYGAVLHSWAFQQVLKSLGVENKIIDYVVDDFEFYNFKFPALSRVKLPFRTRLILLLNSFLYYRRYKKFKSFFELHYDKTNIRYSQKNVSDLDFDVYICESDVVWSPVSAGGLDRIFFFDYPHMKSKLKIAYSASLADMHYNQEKLEFFKEKINNFDFISVRESSAVDFVEQFTQQKVEHVLDPVFLLQSKDYLPIINARKVDSDYVLVYLINRTKGLIKSAKQIAKFYNSKLIIISDLFLYSMYGKTYNNVGVQDFLSLFQNAKYVVTNAFHGTAFSIVFNKNFLVYSRYNKDNKIESILKKTNLKSQLIKEGVIVNKPMEIDYEKVNVIIEEEKIKSLNFIQNALSKYI